MKKSRMFTLCVLAVITAGICVFTSVRVYADGYICMYDEDGTYMPEESGSGASISCLTNPVSCTGFAVGVCDESGQCPLKENTSAPLKKANYECKRWKK